jgi:hypothetical protein
MTHPSDTVEVVHHPTTLAIRDRLIEVLHRQTAQAEPIYDGPCRTCSERADEIIAELAAVLMPPTDHSDDCTPALREQGGYAGNCPRCVAAYGGTAYDGVDYEALFAADPTAVWVLPGPVIDPIATSGIDLIAAERRRQVQVEGYTLEHDREHGAGKLYHAGWALELDNRGLWPRGWAWKPKNPLRDLIRAGALYQASADVASEDWIRDRATGARDQVARMIDDLLAEARTVLLGAGSRDDGS